MELVLGFVAYVLVLIWAFEIVRRLGDHTKLLRRMTDDIAAIRAESQSNNATDG